MKKDFHLTIKNSKRKIVHVKDVFKNLTPQQLRILENEKQKCERLKLEQDQQLELEQQQQSRKEDRDDTLLEADNLTIYETMNDLTSLTFSSPSSSSTLSSSSPSILISVQKVNSKKNKKKCTFSDFIEEERSPQIDSNFNSNSNSNNKYKNEFKMRNKTRRTNDSIQFIKNAIIQEPLTNNLNRIEQNSNQSHKIKRIIKIQDQETTLLQMKNRIQKYFANSQRSKVQPIDYYKHQQKEPNGHQQTIKNKIEDHHRHHHCQHQKNENDKKLPSKKTIKFQVNPVKVTTNNYNRDE
jgi:hypothetical protein